jgi:hypothetical protein
MKKQRTRGIFRPYRSTIQAMTNVEGILGLGWSARSEPSSWSDSHSQIVGRCDETELDTDRPIKIRLPCRQGL